jgi:hypothetical protein
MLKLALVVTFVVLSACSPSHTITTSNGSVTITDKAGKGDGESAVHVTGKDGTSLDINSGKTIADYPSDTPLYEGKSMMDMKAANKNSRVVALQSPDSVEKISAFYKSQFESKGWKVESTVTTPEMNSYVATKENRKLVVVIASDKGSNIQSISQTLSDK